MPSKRVHMQLSLLENGVAFCSLQNMLGMAYRIPIGHVTAFLKSQSEKQRTSKCFTEFCVDKACNYILFGYDSNNNPIAYIGESRYIGTRFPNHHQMRTIPSDGLTRDWKHVVIFCRTDHYFNEGHVLYIERQLILHARQNTQYRLTNAPESVHLLERQNINDADKDIADDFIESIQILTKALGYSLFEPDGIASGTPITTEIPCNVPLFYIRRGGLEASGKPLENGQFLVLKNSQIAESELPSCRSNIKSNRDILKNTGYIGTDSVFVKDCIFTSPSAAASAICGGDASGNSNWRTTLDGDDVELGEWHLMQAKQMGVSDDSEENANLQI